ncbi:hypothetical protein [Microbacterium sp. A84]|uniref:hypothetical protein n=1 Tax=Microbacterium sp. A84 TaxID=3450715 RepID=UPI003F43751F
MTRVDIKPIPHLAFGTAQVADWMVSVESGWFVLEDTKGTWLPDEFVLNGTTPLAPESAPGSQVWDALIAHFRSKVDSLADVDYVGRGKALGQLSWYLWAAGNDQAEAKVLVERGRVMISDPPSNPRGYDVLIKDLERLSQVRMAALLHARRAAHIRRLALDETESSWTLQDAEKAWARTVEAFERTSFTEQVPKMRAALENIRAMIRERAE